MTQFTTLNIGRNLLSFSDYYPENYKVQGIAIYRNLDIVEIRRSTYDILNFLGDLGGLLDILSVIGLFAVGWY
jgi:hypothetical protein